MTPQRLETYISISQVFASDSKGVIMKKSHVVTILNQKLMVRSDASDKAVEEVAGLVSSKIQEVMEKTKSASMLTAALLTCLNIADEFQQQKKRKGESSSMAAEKVKEIIRLIDTHLHEEGPADL